MVCKVDFEAEADDLLARLGEEFALLALEEARGGPWLDERGRRGEECHEIVTGWRGRELSP